MNYEEMYERTNSAEIAMEVFASLYENDWLTISAGEQWEDWQRDSVLSLIRQALALHSTGANSAEWTVRRSSDPHLGYNVFDGGGQLVIGNVELSDEQANAIRAAHKAALAEKDAEIAELEVENWTQENTIETAAEEVASLRRQLEQARADIRFHCASREKEGK